ncbi:MAG: HNH endonuclease [Alphaproteobacteria bacterium]|nr:HNH endonuclease [Alphaproteobacteria bacterium]MCR4555751.1 HNH endonuclease [Alphaproteobacteria bacterium]
MKHLDKMLFSVFRKYVRKNSISSIFLMIFGAIICVFVGIDDGEAIDLYIQKLQSLSEHKIHVNQIMSIRNFYLHNNNRHPPKEHRHMTRHEFNKKKSELKQKWEAQYSMVWPKLTITKKGTTKSFAFEAHHIIPINAGGVNHWWNITPLSPRGHKLLHSSTEEKACFSHNLLEQKYLRFVLKIEGLYKKNFKNYIPKSRFVPGQFSF